jgi:hypothetical protein
VSAVLEFYADAGALVVTALAEQLDGGTAKIYDAGDVLLVTIPLEDPVGVVAGVTLTISATDEAVVAATGTASYVVYHDASDDPVCTGSVTATGGGGSAQLASTSLVALGVASLSGGTIALPEAS